MSKADELLALSEVFGAQRPTLKRLGLGHLDGRLHDVIEAARCQAAKELLRAAEDSRRNYASMAPEANQCAKELHGYGTALVCTLERGHKEPHTDGRATWSVT